MNASPLDAIAAACAQLEHIASAELKIPLDRTLESVATLEEIVSALVAFTEDKDAIRGATFMVGAYFGEILRAHIGGDWQATHGGELALVSADNSCFPIVRVREFAGRAPHESGSLVFYAQTLSAIDPRGGNRVA